MARASREPRAPKAKPAKEAPLWNAAATGGGRGKHLGVRWVAFGLILLVGTGMFVRALRPVNQTIVNESPKVTISTVGEYAAAFVDDWFTWSQDDRAERDSRLKVYNPDLSQQGWNGQGEQTVTTARVFNQEDLGEGKFLVTVRVTVDTTPAAFYVDVLAADIKGAYAVLSVPTLVPGPLLAAVKVPEESIQTEQDRTVVGAIESQIELFFRAWATGDGTLSQFVATDASIAPLDGGMQVSAISSILVPAVPEGGDVDQRSVRADVLWAWPSGGATAPGSYTVDLKKASGKWFVTKIAGGIASTQVAPRASGGVETGNKSSISSGLPSLNTGGVANDPGGSSGAADGPTSDEQDSPGDSSGAIQDSGGQIEDSALSN